MRVVVADDTQLVLLRVTFVFRMYSAAIVKLSKGSQTPQLASGIQHAACELCSATFQFRLS